jgi:hypothetical protein
MTEETRRPKPILRKEVVETATWGEVVVRQLMLSQTMALDVPSAESVQPRDGESDEDHRRRLRVDWARFEAQLLSLAVIPKGEGEVDPLYSQDEWETWYVDNNPQVGVDIRAVSNKARAMNGFRTLDGEDAAKNG